MPRPLEYRCVPTAAAEATEAGEGLASEVEEAEEVGEVASLPPEEHFVVDSEEAVEAESLLTLNIG